MPLFEPIIPARYIALLMAALGNAPKHLRDEWLALCELDERAIRDARTTLSIAKFEALLTAISQYPEFNDLGFEMGLRVRIDDHGPLAPALRRCKTLEQRLQLQGRYFRLMTPIFSLAYRRRINGAEFTCRPAASMAPSTLRLLLEVYAVSMHVNLLATCGARLVPYDVYVSMKAPAHANRYRELRPARFHFVETRLPEVQWVFPNTLLTLPLDWGDSGRFDGELMDLDLLQQLIGRTSKWKDWVRLMLLEAEGCQPTAQELAELLSVSTRTLERTLEREGAFYRDLSKQVRYERARLMLQDPSQSVSQIAYRLGYSDVAAFSSAFKRLAGASPRAFRLK